MIQIIAMNIAVPAIDLTFDGSSLVGRHQCFTGLDASFASNSLSSVGIGGRGEVLIIKDTGRDDASWRKTVLIAYSISYIMLGADQHEKH